MSKTTTIMSGRREKILGLGVLGMTEKFLMENVRKTLTGRAARTSVTLIRNLLFKTVLFQ
jgi:hypothetical protein